ncbi:hypothetical protein PRK78_002328 [Emydomyces testavorans]|uniref:Ankyrin n=1 Tax=Emydomyces testavorans TaxID=2070801 RepID=A0AAF0DEP0_9EURO|nr:hypothetical protein PRK78_002328 [Emydomyces testavorans]
MPQPSNFFSWILTTHEAKTIYWLRLPTEIRDMIMTYVVELGDIGTCPITAREAWEEIRDSFSVCRSWKDSGTYMLCLRNKVETVVSMAPQAIAETAVRMFHFKHEQRIKDPKKHVQTLIINFISTANKLLAIATRRGHHRVMDQLLEWGASPLARTDDGNSILFTATVLRDEHAVTRLLRYGALPDEDGLPSPLAVAAANFDLRIIALLLEHGANMDVTVHYDGRTNHLVEWAAEVCNVEMMRLLIAHGALEWYDPDLDVSHPLVIAIMYECVGMVRLLLENNCYLENGELEEALDDAKVDPSHLMQLVLFEYGAWVLPDEFVEYWTERMGTFPHSSMFI